jgi:hypothetical protein
MDREAFRKYLMNAYVSRKTGRPLNAGTASDVLTRCLRVERALDIDLDQELSCFDNLTYLQERIKRQSRRFQYSGESPYFCNIFTMSIRLYYSFLASARRQLSRSKK